MHNYHADIIWIIDGFLFYASIAIALAILISAASRRFTWHRRTRSLLKIKEHVYEIVLTGKEEHENEFRKLLSSTTPGQFLDITTNRNRELVFFNDTEREIFKKYFLSQKNIERLKKLALRAWDKWLRIEAVMSLGYAGVSDSVGILKKNLLGKDEDVTYFSMIALGQIKTAASGEALIELLKKNTVIRYKLVSILENFPVEILDEVVKLIRDKDHSIRLWAVVIISKFKAERYIDKVEALLGDPSPEVRAAVCECLGKSMKEERAKALKKMLKDDSWLVRASAVKAIDGILGGRSVPIIEPLINDGSISVVSSVKDVMSAHIEEAMPYINKYLTGGDAMAKKMSLEAIEESQYLNKIFTIILSGKEPDLNKAIDLLSGMVASGGYMVIEWAFRNFDDEAQTKIIDHIRKTRPELADNVIRNRNIKQTE